MPQIAQPHQTNSSFPPPKIRFPSNQQAPSTSATLPAIPRSPATKPPQMAPVATAWQPQSSSSTLTPAWPTAQPGPTKTIQAQPQVKINLAPFQKPPAYFNPKAPSVRHATSSASGAFKPPQNLRIVKERQNAGLSAPGTDQNLANMVATTVETNFERFRRELFERYALV